jgi:purine-binding chemotaxis protein CheW
MNHLAFTLCGRHHAMPLSAIQEVLRLPMLQPTEGRPSHIAGLFNLRGQVVEVENLALRLGLPPHAPRAEDNLVVLKGGRSALWVDEIEGVVELESQHQVLDPESGIVTVGAQLYHLLEMDKVEGITSETDRMAFQGVPDPEVSTVLEARAQAYIEIPSSETSHLRSVLAFELNGESFAVDLAEIREITPCPSIHPLPGASKAYLGLVSHRGEPLLVIDLRPMIGLTQAPPIPSAKLLVVEEQDGRIGIYADEVREVLSLDASELNLPILDHQQSEWTDGEWVVEGRPLSLLRLRSILAQTVSTL